MIAFDTREIMESESVPAMRKHPGTWPHLIGGTSVIDCSKLLSPYPELRGVFVGGCVERGVGSSFRAQGHAHTSPDDEFQGWVCVRSQRRLFTARGGWSQLMLHEIAHVLTGHGHDDVWRKKARELGYRLQAHEKKRSRRGHTLVVKDGVRTHYIDGKKMRVEYR